jgi:hypothetical protein
VNLAQAISTIPFFVPTIPEKNGVLLESFKMSACEIREHVWRACAPSRQWDTLRRSMSLPPEAIIEARSKATNANPHAEYQNGIFLQIFFS